MKMKKILSLLTAAAMTLSLGITSVSADTTEETGGGAETTYVAQIGDTKYETLQDAVKAATPGTEITLIGDIDTPTQSAAVLTGNSTSKIQDSPVTINLNGHKVRASGTDGVFKVVKSVLAIKGEGEVIAVEGTDTSDGKNYAMAVYAATTNWSRVEIEGGTYKQECAAGADHELIYAEGRTAIINIRGGKFEAVNPSWTLNINDSSTNAKINITGGTFVNYNPSTDKQDAGVKILDDCTLTSDEGGNYTVSPNGNVKVGDKYFDTISKAVASIDKTGTVDLIVPADITRASLEINGKDITLNLRNNDITAANTVAGNIDVINGGKLTINGDATSSIRSASKGNNTCLVDVRGGSELVLNSGRIEAAFENPLANGNFAVGVWKDCTFTMNGGEIKAGWYCAATNGSSNGSNAKIIINKGTLESTMDYAIYAPAIDGYVEINGGTVNGAAGAIAMNRGTLNMTGGTLISTNKGDTGSKYSDGTCNMHNSVIDFGSKYEGGITATISGGRMNAMGGSYLMRFADYDTNNTNSKYYGVNLTVTGGTFWIDSATDSLFKFGKAYDDKVTTAAISGGTFYKDVAAEKKEFIADGYETVANSGGRYIVSKMKPVAKIGETEYTTLQSAVKDAADGATITLISDVNTKTYAAMIGGKTLTIDLNGHNITSGDAAIYAYDKANVTIDGEGTVTAYNAGNDFAIAVWANNATININNGTYTQKLENVNPTEDNFTLIYSYGGGVININGGTFKPLTPKWTLNLQDNSGSTISVSDGKFFGYDPAAAESEPTKPTSFVADGYASEFYDKEGCYWVVPRDEQFSGVAVMTHGGGKLTLFAGGHYFDYRNVGFIVDFGDGKTETIDTSVVYKEVTDSSNQTKYAATDFSASYIFGAELNLDPSLKDTLKSFTVTPFANVLNKRGEQIKAKAATTVVIDDSDAE